MHVQSTEADPPGLESAPPIPALLEPFSDPKLVRTDFPLLLSSEGVVSLATHFESCEGDQLLRDNLIRLEGVVRQLLDGEEPVDAGGLLEGAAAVMLAQLKLAETPHESLKLSLSKLASGLPEGAKLLPYGVGATWWLILHEAWGHLEPRRAKLRAQAQDLRRQLAELVLVERGQQGQHGGSGLVDFAGIASVRGSIPMPEAHLTRAIESLKVMEREDVFAPLCVIDGGGLPPDWDGDDRCRVIRTSTPYVDAVVAFERQANRVAELIRTLRVARLLLDRTYEPARHDPLIAAFGWRDFSKSESALLAPVFVAETGANLDAHRLGVLVEALSGQARLHVVVETLGKRLPVDLERVGIALGHPFVQQTTPARFTHLIRGTNRALEAPNPALHVIFSGFGEAVSGFLTANAAVEGRAHPLFQYHPEAGTTWAHCLDVSGNPMPESTWPTTDSKGVQVAFTYADFALLDPDLRGEFHPATAEAPTVEQWCALPADQLADAMPAVSAVSGTSVVRLGLSEALAAATLERLRSWRALAEMAGIGNEFARIAADKARQEAEEEALAKHKALIQAHELEIAEIRGQAAEEVYGQLANALLGGKVEVVSTPAPAQKAVSEEAEVEPATPVEEDEELSFDEPWIDSMECTSCNDCLDINSVLFAYDGNKQAIIGDPTAGTFSELVRAAEQCPAKCIHPGKPSNPNEPGLDELIARAEPYNRGGGP